MAFQSYTNMLMVSFTCAVSTNMYDDYCIAFGIHRTDDFFFDTREGLPVAHVRLKWKLAGALAVGLLGCVLLNRVNAFMGEQDSITRNKLLRDDYEETSSLLVARDSIRGHHAHGSADRTEKRPLYRQRAAWSPPD